MLSGEGRCRLHETALRSPTQSVVSTVTDTAISTVAHPGNAGEATTAHIHKPFRKPYTETPSAIEGQEQRSPAAREGMDKVLLPKPLSKSALLSPPNASGNDSGGHQRRKIRNTLELHQRKRAMTLNDFPPPKASEANPGIRLRGQTNHSARSLGTAAASDWQIAIEKKHQMPLFQPKSSGSANGKRNESADVDKDAANSQPRCYDRKLYHHSHTPLLMPDATENTVTRQADYEASKSTLNEDELAVQHRESNTLSPAGLSSSSVAYGNVNAGEAPHPSPAQEHTPVDFLKMDRATSPDKPIKFIHNGSCIDLQKIDRGAPLDSPHGSTPGTTDVSSASKSEDELRRSTKGRFPVVPRRLGPAQDQATTMPSSHNYTAHTRPVQPARPRAKLLPTGSPQSPAHTAPPPRSGAAETAEFRQTLLSKTLPPLPLHDKARALACHCTTTESEIKQLSIDELRMQNALLRTALKAVIGT